MDKTPIEKKIDKLETRLSIAGFVAVILAFGAFLLILGLKELFSKSDKNSVEKSDKKCYTKNE